MSRKCWEKPSINLPLQKMIQIKARPAAKRYRPWMTTPFYIAALTDNQVAQALPLIQVTWPEADMDSWRRFARSFTDPVAQGDSGILLLHEAEAYICGILAFRRDAMPSEGGILSIPLFTVADLANRPDVTKALLDAADRKAASLGCRTLNIRLYSQQIKLADRLRLLGLSSVQSLWLTVGEESVNKAGPDDRWKPKT